MAADPPPDPLSRPLSHPVMPPPSARPPAAGPTAPDPGRIATQHDFGTELTRARARAGLTIRQVAKASGIPVSTVGGYCAGRHLPPATQPELLPAILSACGITDPEELGRWQQALSRARRPPGKRPAHAPVPYRGLASFQPEEADWFFGREELTLHLARLATGTHAPGLPLAVVGPSGSGKSSLLRAGLAPRLMGGSPLTPRPRPVLLFTPGPAPLTALVRHLRPTAGSGDAPGGDPAETAAALRGAPDCGARLSGWAEHSKPAIIVDQFEEIFTACQDEAERQAFVSALAAVSGTTLVVFGLRADFYGHALRYPELARSLQERQVAIGPMAQEQLRRVIVEPARKAGLEIEPGLVELLLRELRPRVAGITGAGHDAGALPLLSHALRATWERSHAGRLTVADYQASGGIRDAIARTAEAAYATLDEEAKEASRHLFLRLIHVADDAIETRARVPLSDLPAGGNGDGAGVLAQFVERRLVTLDAAAAEITHEALLDAWPRLRAWIDADREEIRFRRFVTTAAQAWQEAGREPAALLRGGPLALARTWAENPASRGGLRALTREFIDAGVAEEEVQQSAQRRRTRRLRQLVATLTVLVLATVSIAAYALQQRSYALQQGRQAAAAKNVADSRTVAIEAGQLRAENPSLAAQLSLAAYQIAPTTGARASLLESSGAPAASRIRDSAGVVESVSLGPAHRLLAVASAHGTLRLWNVARPGHPVRLGASLTPAGGALYTVVFSPDGHLLAAAGAGGTVRLWRVSATGAAVSLGPGLTGPRNTVYSLAFSPGGHLLAAGSADKTVRLWNVTNPAHPVPLGAPITGPTQMVDTVAFSPDGHLLAAGSRDASVWLWNISKPSHPARTRGPLRGARDWVNAVAFSPDGTVLAAASSDDRVLLWNVATGALLGTLPHPQPVTSLAWDGPHLLVTGAADGFARTWRIPPPVLLTGGPVNGISFSRGGGTLAVGGRGLQLWNAAGHDLKGATLATGMVNTVAFAPGGHLLAAGYGDGRIQLWQASPHLAPLGAPQTASATGLVEFVAFRRDGRVLATAGDDGTVRLWEVSGSTRLRPLATLHASASYMFSVAFSPDGKVLAAAGADGLTRLWNVADPAHPVPLGRPLAGPTSYAISVAFSPDGAILAVGSADETVRLWNVADPAHPSRIGPTLTGPAGYVYSVAFSPDGSTLAAGATDGSVWLWSIAHPSQPHLLARLTTTAGHIYTVAFSPGGRTLAAAGSDGSVWLWDTRPAAAAAAVCATSGQPLTRAEWRTYVPGRAYHPPCAGG